MNLNHVLTPEKLSIFETLPDLYLILSSGLVILTASNAYLNATLTERETLVGKHIFEAFPDNPNTPEANGVNNLKVSLQMVLSTKKPHQMPLQHYDVPRPAFLGGGFEQKYWSPLNTPVLDGQGEVIYLIHKVEDVTEQVLTRKKAEESQAQLQILYQDYGLAIDDLNASQIEIKYARAQADLERHKLHNILMQAPAMICIFEGPAHVFKLVNPPYQRLVGERRILGKPIAEAMPELAGQPFFGLLDEVYRTGESFEAHEMQVQLDHDNAGALGKNYYNFIYQALRTLNGEIEGILVFAYQVTAQVEARQQVEQSKQALQIANAELAAANEELRAANEEIQAANEQLEERVMERTREAQVARSQAEAQRTHLLRVFEQAPVAICVFKGADYLLEVVNPQMGDMLGRSSTQLISKPFFEAMPELANQGLKELLDQVRLTGKPYVANEQRVRLQRHASQEAGYFNFVYQPLRDEYGLISGITCVATEVTPQVLTRQRVEQSEKQAQAMAEELAAANEEIIASNEELGQSNLALLRTNVDLDNFIYTASHDLKAPISNIESLLSALLRTLPAEILSTERTGRITTMMQESIERFKRTIANLTEVIKLQKENSREAVSVNLSEVIREVSLDLAPQIKSVKAKLKVEVVNCPSVHFSEKNLRSVVYNLLSNSIKYHSPQRVPEINIYCKRIPNYQVLTIKDNGLGMENGRLSQLFTMFKRFHDHVEGTGIGLYMVKKMVENAGGKIEVESRVGEGSTFRIYFPR